MAEEWTVIIIDVCDHFVMAAAFFTQNMKAEDIDRLTQKLDHLCENTDFGLHWTEGELLFVGPTPIPMLTHQKDFEDVDGFVDCIIANHFIKVGKSSFAELFPDWKFKPEEPEEEEVPLDVLATRCEVIIGPPDHDSFEVSGAPENVKKFLDALVRQNNLPDVSEAKLRISDAFPKTEFKTVIGRISCKEPNLSNLPRPQRGWIHSCDPFEIQRNDEVGQIKTDEEAAAVHRAECGCSWPEFDYVAAFFAWWEGRAKFNMLGAEIEELLDVAEDRASFLDNAEDLMRRLTVILDRATTVQDKDILTAAEGSMKLMKKLLKDPEAQNPFLFEEEDMYSAGDRARHTPRTTWFKG